MTRAEIDDEIEYWSMQIERCQQQIFEYEDNISELLEQSSRAEE